MGGAPSSTAKPATKDSEEDYSSLWDETQSGESDGKFPSFSENKSVFL